jgi:hypothetical protein
MTALGNRGTPLSLNGFRRRSRYAPPDSPTIATPVPPEDALRRADVPRVFVLIRAVSMCLGVSCLLDAYWGLRTNKYLQGSVRWRCLFSGGYLVGEGGIEPPTPCL